MSVSDVWPPLFISSGSSMSRCVVAAKPKSCATCMSEFCSRPLPEIRSKSSSNVSSVSPRLSAVGESSDNPKSRSPAVSMVSVLLSVLRRSDSATTAPIGAEPNRLRMRRPNSNSARKIAKPLPASHISRLDDSVVLFSFAVPKANVFPFGVLAISGLSMGVSRTIVSTAADPAGATNGLSVLRITSPGCRSAGGALISVPTVAVPASSAVTCSGSMP